MQQSATRPDPKSVHATRIGGRQYPLYLSGDRPITELQMDPDGGGLRRFGVGAATSSGADAAGTGAAAGEWNALEWNVGGDLREEQRATLAADPETPIGRQKKKIREMMRDFHFEINKGKTLDKEGYRDKLLKLLDLKLFGYFSTQRHAEEQNAEFPFRKHLKHTKKAARVDLPTIGKVVSQWDLRGGEVRLNSELSFRPRGEVMNFFKQLQWLERLNDGTKLGMSLYREEFNKLYGTIPGETRNFDQLWNPEEMTRLVMNSTEDEAVMAAIDEVVFEAKRRSRMSRYRVDTVGGSISGGPGAEFPGARVIEKPLGPNPELTLDFGYISTPAQAAAASITGVQMRETITGSSNDLSRGGGLTFRSYDLKAEEIFDARDFNEEIPASEFRELTKFVADITGGLALSVPFKLTPELFVITGPVTISYTHFFVQYPDPVIVLIFNEFPNHIIPIVMWLPTFETHQMFTPGQ